MENILISQSDPCPEDETAMLQVKIIGVYTLTVTYNLKCIFCMFHHEIVVVVQCTKHPRKYVCRHQDIYPTLTITGDIVKLSQAVI